MKKRHIIISDQDFYSSNRGRAALAHGVLPFLAQTINLADYDIVKLKRYNNIFSYGKRSDTCHKITVRGVDYNVHAVYIFSLYYWIIRFLRIRIPVKRLNNILDNTEYIALGHGGDGFSDTYGTKALKSKMIDIHYAMVYNVPVMQLPQTLGPFQDTSNFKLAKKILKYSKKVYVRDLTFQEELEAMGVDYELTHDMSYYMLPEPVDHIEIQPKSVGINIGGFAHSNTFLTLANKFDHYPALIKGIVTSFQKKKIPVYLVPHSYDYKRPEANNDDLEAIKALYNSLEEKEGVYLIDENLIAPQKRYLISQFDFFIGTRLQACLSAIHTQTPVFGLAYSSKFEGTFKEYGIPEHYENILDLEREAIPALLSKLENSYARRNQIYEVVASQ